MIAPAVKYFEYDIRGRAEDFASFRRRLRQIVPSSRPTSRFQSRGDPSEGHRYRISASHAVRRHPPVHPFEYRSEPLPERIETVLQQNMGLLLTYLKRGEFP